MSDKFNAQQKKIRLEIVRYLIAEYGYSKVDNSFQIEGLSEKLIPQKEFNDPVEFESKEDMYDDLIAILYILPFYFLDIYKKVRGLL